MLEFWRALESESGAQFVLCSISKALLGFERNSKPEAPLDSVHLRNAKTARIREGMLPKASNARDRGISPFQNALLKSGTLKSEQRLKSWDLRFRNVYLSPGALKLERYSISLHSQIRHVYSFRHDRITFEFDVRPNPFEFVTCTDIITPSLIVAHHL